MEDNPNKYEHNVCGMQDKQDDILENKLAINDEYLDTVLHELFFDDVRIFYVNHHIKKQKIFHPSGKYPPIQMHFLLEGINTMKSLRTGAVCRFTGNQNNIVYLPHTEMDYTMSTDKVHLLGIQFQREFFYRFIDEHSELLSTFWNNVEKRKETRLVNERNLPLTPRMELLISEIMNSERGGYLKKLFLESRIIELLMLQLEQADFYTKYSGSISRDDKEKLFAVKELMEEDVLSKFTLRELAHQVGLNEFKLKKGFKELFGKTVFTYFNDLRMEYARKLLLDDGKMVYEVADILGYSESHHFAHAFKKKFGVTPGSFK